MKCTALWLTSIALVAAPAFAVDSCSNFSGNWEGTCTAGGAPSTLKVTLKQEGCAKLSGEGTTFELDGQTHQLKDISYAAQWEPSRGAANVLHVVAHAAASGVTAEMRYDFAEAADKSQTLKVVATRKLSGPAGENTKPEVIEDCEAKKVSAN